MDNREYENHEDLFDQKPLEDARIPFRDLRVKDPVLVRKLLKAVEDVLVHGPIIAGKRVELFEKNMGAYCGRSYCIGVSSASLTSLANGGTPPYWYEWNDNPVTPQTTPTATNLLLP